MKIVVTDAEPLGSIDRAPLDALGRVTWYESTRPEQRLERVQDAAIIVTNKVVIDAPLIDACPHLKMIAITATGMDNVDVAHAQAKGIPVQNVAGYSTHSVAQHTFASLLYLFQQLRYFDDYTASGRYVDSATFTHLGPEFAEIRGKCWGILGLGAIGQQVATIATAFGAEVIYHTRSDKGVPYPRVDLEELLQRADILSIHTPLTPQTKGLLGAGKLALLPPTAYLVNVARGGIVDEAALADMITGGRIAGVATDVFDGEPIRAENPLLKIAPHPRLLMTPHIAWASQESRQELFRLVCANIEAFLKG